MKVITTPRAQRRVEAIAQWWRKERPSAPELFEEELLSALRKLAEGPTFGLVYGTHRGFPVRRILLPDSNQHLYFSVNREAEVVTVLALWGARRGRTPRF